MKFSRNAGIASAILAGSLVTVCVTWMNRAPGRGASTHKVSVARLPLSFEVNRGQAAAEAKFLARGAGYALALTGRGEPVLALHSQPRQRATSSAETQQWPAGGDASRQLADRAVLRLEFPGGNPHPEFQPEAATAARTNYLIGNDPAKWITGVPHYSRARFREVYPGVDLLYYAKDQQLEYDFILRPGTDPDSVRMKVHGAQAIEPGEGQGLVLKTSSGDVQLHKPVAWQRGPAGETEVACNYILDGGEIRFALGDYDRRSVLRIDPVLSYSTTVGMFLNAIAVDSSGNSYLAGNTSATDFPTTSGVFQPALGGDSDIVVAKLDPTGSNLIFATYLGGGYSDSATGIAVDSGGNVIVAGTSGSANFPMTGAFQSTLLGDASAVISKLSPSGDQLLYSTYLGGSVADSAGDVALDSNGRVVVVGSTLSPDFPATSGTLQATLGGGSDAFVAKLDTTKSSAASLLFATFLGGGGAEDALAVAVDAAGFAVVAGTTYSSNFPTASAFQAACASCPGEPDVFVSKLNADGTALAYSTFLGGRDYDYGVSVALDSSGNAYVAGTTYSDNFPATSGAIQRENHGAGDAFVTKLAPTGSALVYSSFLGGKSNDTGEAVTLDSLGNAYVVGSSYSTDFPLVNPLQAFSAGVCDDGWSYYDCYDATITQINGSGSALLFSTFLGGTGIDDLASSASLDAAGNIYTAGTTGGANPGGFVAKVSLSSSGSAPSSIALSSSPNPSDQNREVTFTATVAPPGASGAVTFREEAAVLGSANIGADGTAAITFRSLSAGNHPITAEYWGNANFAGASTVFTHSVRGITMIATKALVDVPAGETATFQLLVDQTGPLTSPIAFSCANMIEAWNCSFNPTTVPAGNGPTPVTVSVRTRAISGTPVTRLLGPTPLLPYAIALGALALFLLTAFSSRQLRRPAYLRLSFALGLAALVLGVAACGSGPSASTPRQPVTVSFQVTATSGVTTASIPLSVTVR